MTKHVNSANNHACSFHSVRPGLFLQNMYTRMYVDIGYHILNLSVGEKEIVIPELFTGRSKNCCCLPFFLFLFLFFYLTYDAWIKFNVFFQTRMRRANWAVRYETHSFSHTQTAASTASEISKISHHFNSEDSVERFVSNPITVCMHMHTDINIQ